MENEKVKCLSCGTERVVKVGKSPSGHQRYRCLEATCFVKTFQLEYKSGGYMERFTPIPVPKIWRVRPFQMA